MAEPVTHSEKRARSDDEGTQADSKRLREDRFDDPSLDQV